MQARSRRLTATLGACAALVGLTACEQPTPAVTLYSSGTSIHDTAVSFCFPGQDLAKEPGTDGACRFDTADRVPKVLGVQPGEEVLVDVDRDIADAGFLVLLNGTPVATGAAEHTARFQPDFNQGTILGVEVRKLADPQDPSRATGIWQFQVVPD